MRRSFLTAHLRASTRSVVSSASAVALAALAHGQAVELKPVHMPALEAIGHSSLVGRAPASQMLHLCVCLNMPHPDALQSFVDDVSNPLSPNYRQFLSPTEVGQKFGQPQAAVASVAQYLQQQGFHLNLVAKDNLHILADGTVAQAEAAFHTKINQYHSLSPSETGHIDYISNSSDIQLPKPLASIVEGVEGLQTWNKAKPLSCLTPGQASVLYNTQPLTSTGVLGQGRTIGISSWDGFALSNTALFLSTFGIPVPAGGALSNISVVTINGGSESGQRLAEGDLDPQMVVGQAPLSNIIIYDGPGGGDTATDPQVLSVYVREENDDKADIITESYAWALAPHSAMSAHVAHLAMSAEGITYMAASGDDQSTEEQQYWYPDCEPEVLLVGGTSANVNSNGSRQSEVVWDSGSGGWSLFNVPFNVLPSWQKGTGVPTQYNYRLNPDVAGHASGTPYSSEGAYYFYYYGGLNSGYIGTSFACPIFAGGLAVAEQQLITLGKLTKDKNGHYRLGRLQDLIYSQNGNPSVWYDITQGNNGYLPNGLPSNAGPGWDTCTGWGAVNWAGFVNAYPTPRK